MIAPIAMLFYTALSVVFGRSLLGVIPRRYTPLRSLPANFETAAVVVVVLSSIAWALLTARDLALNFNASFTVAALQTLYGTSQGIGVLGTLGFAALWFGADALAGQRLRKPLLLIAALGLVASAGAATHAATLSTRAALAQLAHLYAVSAWLGILFIVGFFGEPRAGGAAWRPFYRWFTPVAAVCVAVVVLSGLGLMSELSDDWLNAWALDYGQTLLVKHLLFVPLLVFAAINGFFLAPLARRRPYGFDPRGWMCAESLLALAIFAVTAVLGRTAPPHDVAETLRFTPPSEAFLRWYDGGVITPALQLGFAWDAVSLMLVVLALSFLGVVFAVFARRRHPSLAVGAAFAFAALMYAALMSALLS